MKRTIFAMITLASLAGFAWSQDEKRDVPEITPRTVDPIAAEFNTVMREWLEYNNWDKEVAYTVITDLNTKIREDFPMNPATLQAISELDAKEQAELSALAKEMGYDHYKDAMTTDNPRAGEFRDLMSNYSQLRGNLTREYSEEFNRRYQTACIDAMKRLMENGNAMK
jgi:hypothetical protein